MSKQWKGNTGTPLTYPRASRKTEDRYSQRPVIPAIDDDDRYYEQPKPRTSSVRYDRPQVRQTAYMDKNNPKKTRRVRERTLDKWTLIMVVCILLMVMVGGWFIFTKIQEAWTSIHDNFVYGTPFRTDQKDQYMNLGDSLDHPDHFIALNLHGVIEVIQINPLDSRKDKIYVLASVGDANTPVSLSFSDTTGSGRTDVIVTIGEATPYTIVLLNNGTALTPSQPAH